MSSRTEWAVGGMHDVSSQPDGMQWCPVIFRLFKHSSVVFLLPRPVYLFDVDSRSSSLHILEVEISSFRSMT